MTEIWKPLNFSHWVFAILVKVSVQRKALIRTICCREIFTKKYRQQQNFDSDPKEAWHYNHVTFTPIAKNFMLYRRLIYMLFILYVRLTIKVKVGIPASFKVEWYPHKITGSSHLKFPFSRRNWRSRSSLFPVNRRRRHEIRRVLMFPITGSSSLELLMSYLGKKL